jgi:hypothetical protein
VAGSREGGRWHCLSPTRLSGTGPSSVDVSPAGSPGPAGCVHGNGPVGAAVGRGEPNLGLPENPGRAGHDGRGLAPSSVWAIRAVSTCSSPSGSTSGQCMYPASPPPPGGGGHPSLHVHRRDVLGDIIHGYQPAAAWPTSRPDGLTLTPLAKGSRSTSGAGGVQASVSAYPGAAIVCSWPDGHAEPAINRRLRRRRWGIGSTSGSSGPIKILVPFTYLLCKSIGPLHDGFGCALIEDHA